MLIQEQSYKKLLEAVANDGMFVIVSISPQTTASVADYFSCTTIEAFLKIASVLKSIGVKYVFDLSATGDVALVETREEFLLRFQQSRQQQQSQQLEWTVPKVCSTAVSSTRINIIDDGKKVGAELFHSNNSSTNRVEPDAATSLFHEVDAGLPSLNPHLPLIVSACPGWICYAEKTQPQALPYASTTKSAQQILGSLVKLLLWEHIEHSMALKSNNARGESSLRPFVVSIQPCFDKKLEASRKVWCVY